MPAGLEPADQSRDHARAARSEDDTFVSGERASTSPEQTFGVLAERIAARVCQRLGV